jgi:hypothetical protein
MYICSAGHSQTNNHLSEPIPQSTTPYETGEFDASRLGVQRIPHALIERHWNITVGIVARDVDDVQ